MGPLDVPDIESFSRETTEILSACHLYANFLLHKLTLEPGVTPHMVKSAPILSISPPCHASASLSLSPGSSSLKTKVKTFPFIYLGE